MLNLLCCGLYIASGVLLMSTVFSELYYTYHTSIGFTAYPALTAVYIVGFVAGLIHLADALLAFVAWRKCC